jgi:hypothetical protein
MKDDERNRMTGRQDMNQLTVQKMESRICTRLFVVLMSLCGTTAAQNYSIPWYVVGGGGANMSSANYGVNGTLAQTAIGTVAGTNYQVAQGYWAGSGPTTPVIRNAGEQGPHTYAFYQNQPNPATGVVTFRYDLPRESRVVFRIFALDGKLVQELINETEKPGCKHVRWVVQGAHGSLVPAGIYVCRFQADEFLSIKKMIVR